MLDALKEYGLEICGASFTVTGVNICNDGFVMPEGAIWGGYLSDDVNDYTGYFLKVLTKWDPETVWANNDQIIHNPKVATIDLQNIDVAASLADVNALMIQGNKETGNPFNITAVVLRNENGSSGLDITFDSIEDRLVDVYNLHGMKIRSNAPLESATDGLHAGIYIVNNKKIIIR